LLRQSKLPDNYVVLAEEELIRYKRINLLPLASSSYTGLTPGVNPVFEEEAVEGKRICHYWQHTCCHKWQILLS
jgi:hypothetical protein